MTNQLELSGYENLSGQTTENGLFVERLVARTPAPVWNVKCVRCNATFTISHAKVRYSGCPSSNCGIEPRVRNYSAVNNPQVAVRSRDAASIRDLQRAEQQGTNAPMKWGEQPSPAWFATADPDSVRRYLDVRDKRGF